MPFYVVENTLTGAIDNLPNMSFADLQKFLRENPVYTQVITAPAFVKVN